MSDADRLSDAEGTEMDRDDVEELAAANVRASMSIRELANLYVDVMDDEALVQWATDDEGNFPK